MELRLSTPNLSKEQISLEGIKFCDTHNYSPFTLIDPQVILLNQKVNQHVSFSFAFIIEYLSLSHKMDGKDIQKCVYTNSLKPLIPHLVLNRQIRTLSRRPAVTRCCAAIRLKP